MPTVRGMNSPNKQRILRGCILKSKPEIIMIQETKPNAEEAEIVKRKLGIREMSSYPSNWASSGIAVIWDPRVVAFQIDRSQSNWMSGWVKGIKNNLYFLLINVYDPIQNRDKRRIWNEIYSYLRTTPNQICIIGGDFNAILDQNEKRGGRRIISQSERDFCNWVHKTNLIEIKMTEDTYTWNNKRSGFNHIAEKLDRFFVRGSLINFPNSLSAMSFLSQGRIITQFNYPLVKKFNPRDVLLSSNKCG